MSLTTNLISHWPLGEASGNALDAHGSNHLTETAGPIASAAGKVGNARDFDGPAHQYFERADNADLSTGNIDFTFSCWVNAESFFAVPIIANKGWVGENANSEWQLIYLSSRFELMVMSGTTLTEVIANNFGAPSLSTWYHIVCWHDSVNNLIGISVNNGTPNTTSTSAGVNNGTGTFQIGAMSFANVYWDGLIDECSFWKRVLTADERTALYNGGNGLAYAAWTPVAGAVVESALTATSVTLTADAPSGGVSPYTYQWYRSTTQGFTPSGANDIAGATSLTLNDTGLTPGTTYYYVLRVTDSLSQTADTVEEAVTTTAASSGSPWSAYISDVYADGVWAEGVWSDGV